MHGYRSKPHTPAAHLKKTAGSFGCSSPEIRTYRYWWYTYFCLLSLWFFNYHCYHHYNHYIYIFIYFRIPGNRTKCHQPKMDQGYQGTCRNTFWLETEKLRDLGPQLRAPLWNMCWFNLTPWIDQKGSANSWQYIYIYTYTYIYTHIYIHIYIYIGVCVCMSMWINHGNSQTRVLFGHFGMPLRFTRIPAVSLDDIPVCFPMTSHHLLLKSPFLMVTSP